MKRKHFKRHEKRMTIDEEKHIKDELMVGDSHSSRKLANLDGATRGKTEMGQSPTRKTQERYSATVSR